MSCHENDIFYETVREAEEETKMRIEQALCQSIESMKFVQRQINKALGL